MLILLDFFHWHLQFKSLYYFTVNKRVLFRLEPLYNYFAVKFCIRPRGFRLTKQKYVTKFYSGSLSWKTAVFVIHPRETSRQYTIHFTTRVTLYLVPTLLGLLLHDVPVNGRVNNFLCACSVSCSSSKITSAF